MSKKIKLYQFASGSWPDKIGDTTLYYTENYSRRANSVGGIFLDNPPRLSPNCAGLIWRYYADTDRYLLIHVQGSQVVNSAMGRDYPFRAGYEVSRDDMNVIHFNLPAILKAVPRIATMKGGRVALETEVDDRTTWPRGTQALADNILQAILQGKQIFIALEVMGREYHEDKVFDAPELKTLLGAIGMLPEDVRRYAAFGFCVDGCYSLILKNVPVVVYLKERPIEIPKEAVRTTWQEVTIRTVVKNDGSSLSFKLPGANEKLLPADQLQRTIVVSKKKTQELTSDDWPVWLSMKHSLVEITTDDWETFADYYGRMDEATQKKYVESVQENSVKWKMNSLTKELFDLMNYNETQIRLMQSQTVPLKHLLLKDGLFDFLYPKGELPHGLYTAINAKFLQNLRLTEKEPVSVEIERWYGIFNKYNRTDDMNVRNAFKDLFEEHIIPKLTRQADILRYMKEYPFISGRCYKKPHNFQPLTEKDLSSLKQEYQQLFIKWRDEEIRGIHFDNIHEVIDLLHIIVDKKSRVNILKVEAMKRMKHEKLSTLLLKDMDKFDANCEELLQNAVALPKTWKDFAINTILSAVNGVLFQDLTAKIADDELLDVSEWSSLCHKYQKFPHIFSLIKNRLKILVGNNKNVCKEMVEFITNHFVQNESQDESTTIILKPEDCEKTAFENIKDLLPSLKWKKESTEMKPYPYINEADAAYPLIDELIKILKKMNNREDSKQLEKLFSELKVANKSKRYKIRQLMTGFVVGIILALVCAVVYKTLPSIDPSKEETQTEDFIPSKESHIVFAKYASLDKQLMLQLASMAGQDTIEKIIIGNLEFTNVCPTDMEALQRCNTAYYQVADTTTFAKMKAIFREDVKGKNLNEQKRDTVIISPVLGQSLLEVSANHLNQLLASLCYQTTDEDGNMVKKVIDIPNATIRSTLFKNDTVNIYMDKPRYYFQVIKSIEAKLKEDGIDARVPY